MTKENFTAIAVIIDASGSMAGLTNDTIGNFNNFVAEQKAIPGEAVFSLCTFNNHYNLVHDLIPLQNVAELSRLTYRANGGTALLDAMGTTIDSLGAKFAAMPEHERPSKVIVLVITDGEENSSVQYSTYAGGLDRIKEKVTHQREKYSWEFVFIGANIDAISAGTSMGFSAANSVGYVASAAGTDQLYSSISSNLGAYRSSFAPAQVDFFAQTGITPTGATAPVDQTVVPVDQKITFDPGQIIPTTK